MVLPVPRLSLAAVRRLACCLPVGVEAVTGHHLLLPAVVWLIQFGLQATWFASRAVPAIGESAFRRACSSDASGGSPPQARQAVFRPSGAEDGLLPCGASGRRYCCVTLRAIRCGFQVGLFGEP